jgi:hypothetical protein
MLIEPFTAKHAKEKRKEREKLPQSAQRRLIDVNLRGRRAAI